MGKKAQEGNFGAMRGLGKGGARVESDEMGEMGRSEVRKKRGQKRKGGGGVGGGVALLADVRF